MTSSARISLATLALTALTLPVADSFAQAAPAYTITQSGQTFARLQDAVNTIGGGSGTIRVSTGRHQDCAVQTAGQIAYIAAVPGQAVFDGVTCEGKAALVLRGVSASVAGLVFTNMRVPDFNGAGIRLEHGDLTVSQAWFRDSQQGILTGPDPDGSLRIDQSTFSRLGTCEGAGGCAHSVYVGDYGSASVTRSRF